MASTQAAFRKRERLSRKAISPANWIEATAIANFILCIGLVSIQGEMITRGSVKQKIKITNAFIGPPFYSGNPERVASIQPRVARNELPWVTTKSGPTL